MEATIIRRGGQPAGAMVSTGRSNRLNLLAITVLKRGLKNPYSLKGRDPINISHSSSRILGRARKLAWEWLMKPPVRARLSVSFSFLIELNIIQPVSACQQFFHTPAGQEDPQARHSGESRNPVSLPARHCRRFVTSSSQHRSGATDGSYPVEPCLKGGSMFAGCEGGRSDPQY